MNSSLLLLASRALVCLAYYAVFLFGYCLAWVNFKPKHLRGGRSSAATDADARLGATKIEPKIRQLPLSDSQLGLSPLGNTIPSSSDQRRLKMEEKLRLYAEERPENAALLVRSWLQKD